MSLNIYSGCFLQCSYIDQENANTASAYNPTKGFSSFLLAFSIEMFMLDPVLRFVKNIDLIMQVLKQW